jgi:hypothetical protein
MQVGTRRDLLEELLEWTDKKNVSKVRLLLALFFLVPSQSFF